MQFNEICYKPDDHEDCIVIETLNEFMNHIPTKNRLFRGQTQCWKLIPSLFRKPLPRRVPDWAVWETLHMVNFQRNARPYLDGIPENALDWLVLAQHYRLPTRLLDWTISPLAALYFAVKDSFNEQYYREYLKPSPPEYSIVWAVSRDLYAPVYASDIQNNQHFIFAAEDVNNKIKNNIEQYGVPALNAAAYQPPIIDTRVATQKSYFTIHLLPESESDFVPMDELAIETQIAPDSFVKILIPWESRTQIQHQLGEIGYDALSVFPDLEGVAASVIETVERERRDNF